jgi:8-oxo-dGTP diphosphatase
MDVTKYALGFAFSWDLKEVLLIEKNRPAWQKGFLNGVGGHVEAGESGLQCCVREFTEETGLFIPGAFWQYVGVMEGTSANVEVFATETDLSGFASITDEIVDTFFVSDVIGRKIHTLPNVPTLVQLCLNKIEGQSKMDQFRLTYHG